MYIHHVYIFKAILHNEAAEGRIKERVLRKDLVKLGLLGCGGFGVAG